MHAHWGACHALLLSEIRLARFILQLNLTTHSFFTRLLALHCMASTRLLEAFQLKPPFKTKSKSLSGGNEIVDRVTTASAEKNATELICPIFEIKIHLLIATAISYHIVTMVRLSSLTLPASMICYMSMSLSTLRSITTIFAYVDITDKQTISPHRVSKKAGIVAVERLTGPNFYVQNTMQSLGERAPNPINHVMHFQVQATASAQHQCIQNVAI